MKLIGINPFRTLQGKFTFFLSLLIIFLLSGLSYLTIAHEKAFMEEALYREAEALVESMAISCTNTMLYEEIGLVEEGGLLDNYIADLMQRKDFPILYAMVLDTQGKVLTHHSVKEVGMRYQDEVTLKAIRSWHTIRQYPSPTVLDLSTPLAISTKRWGTLRIGVSLEPLRKDVALLTLNYVFYTVGFIIIAVAAIAILFRFITRPIHSLAKTMDGTTVHSKIPEYDPSRQDEIGVLERSFYRMVQRIQADEKDRERTQRSLLLTEKMVAIGKLTAGVAHEINNPLGGILNCLYRLKKSVLPPERQSEYLDLMEDGIKRIQKTVTGLLGFARNPNVDRSPIPIGTLIEKVLSLLEYEIRKAGIMVVKEIDPDIPPVSLDRDQMGQVMVNLF